MTTSALDKPIDKLEAGEASKIGEITAAAITAAWASAKDYDLMAVVVPKTGESRLIHFNDKGNINADPFIQHSGDEGVGDKKSGAAGNTETIAIGKLDPTKLKAIHFSLIDYPQAKTGHAARWSNDDHLKITLTDSSNPNAQECGTIIKNESNVIHMASIVNRDGHFVIVNTGGVGHMLHELTPASMFGLPYYTAPGMSA